MEHFTLVKAEEIRASSKEIRPSSEEVRPSAEEVRPSAEEGTMPSGTSGGLGSSGQGRSRGMFVVILMRTF